MNLLDFTGKIPDVSSIRLFFRIII